MALLMQVRIVCIDYYLAPPLAQVDVCYSSFGGTAIDRVPVVRVFGSTPAGQKYLLAIAATTVARRSR